MHLRVELRMALTLCSDLLQVVCYQAHFKTQPDGVLGR
jgi:hypothetical protein